MQGRRRSWLIGGIGLIACSIVGIARGSALGAPAANLILTLVSDVMWACAILVLSIGLSREASVVARKPMGLTACAVVALWPLANTLVALIVIPQNPRESAPWELWTYLSIAVPLMFGLIAAMHVARIRTVPAPWNWAPLWALGVRTATWLVPQAIGVASPRAFMELAAVIPVLGTLGFLSTTLGLGIAATVLSNRSRAGTVLVFESSRSEQP